MTGSTTSDASAGMADLFWCLKGKWEGTVLPLLLEVALGRQVSVTSDLKRQAASAVLA
jgi:hypothetical protein